jgi:hypothetical protein
MIPASSGPVFAELKLGGGFQVAGGMCPSVLVTIGMASIGIGNYADSDVVSNVIRMVREIC